MVKSHYLPVLAFLLCLFLFSAALMYGASSGDDWLHTSGNRIVDQGGKDAWLTGINWFGFEETECIFHGLWVRDLKGTLDLIADMGFNIVRVPIHARLVDQWRQGTYPAPQSISTSASMNSYLEGASSLDALDITIEYCGQIGLKIMMDMHSINPHGYMDEGVWYLDDFSTSQFISCWEFLANRYKNTDVVLAMDLSNEPHDGNDGVNAKWDNSNDANNWKRASENIASAIHAINPNLLILVEGIQTYTDPDIPHISQKLNIEVPDWWDLTVHGTWWGGNLMGVRDYPVDLGSRQNRLVYSPHDYGPSVYTQPWFEGNFTRSTMDVVWEHFWFFIYQENTAPLLIGEWGGKMDSNNTKWMGYLRDLIVEYKISHTFWCLNPNSGDTGGIFADSGWTSIDTSKYNFIEPTLWQSGGSYVGLDHEVGLGASGTNIAQVGGGTVPTTPPTTPSTPEPTEEVTAQPTAEPTSPPTETPVPGDTCLPGDVNRSESVDIVDALLVAQFYVGLAPSNFYEGLADVNESGSIDIVDALLIAQIYVGLVEQPDPVPC